MRAPKTAPKPVSRKVWGIVLLFIGLFNIGRGLAGLFGVGYDLNVPGLIVLGIGVFSLYAGVQLVRGKPLVPGKQSDYWWLEKDRPPAETPVAKADDPTRE